MNTRKLTKVRHFGITIDGVIVATNEKGTGESVGYRLDPNHMDDFKKRMKSILGVLFLPVTNVLIVDGETVTKDDAECVYNDASLLNTLCGLGTYEQVANSYELAVLAELRNKGFTK